MNYCIFINLLCFYCFWYCVLVVLFFFFNPQLWPVIRSRWKDILQGIEIKKKFSLLELWMTSVKVLKSYSSTSQASSKSQQRQKIKRLLKMEAATIVSDQEMRLLIFHTWTDIFPSIFMITVNVLIALISW